MTGAGGFSNIMDLKLDNTFASPMVISQGKDEKANAKAKADLAKVTAEAGGAKIKDTAAVEAKKEPKFAEKKAD